MCCLGYNHGRADWQTQVNLGDYGTQIQHYSVGEELAEYESWLYSLEESYKHFWTVPNLYLIIEKNQQALVIVAQSSDFDLSRCTIALVSNSGQYYQFQSSQNHLLRINKAIILLNTTETESKLIQKYPEYSNENPNPQFRYVRVNSLRWSVQPGPGNQFVITRDNATIPHKEIYPIYSCTCDLPDTTFHV